MSATLKSKPKVPKFIGFLLVIALGIAAAKVVWMFATPKTEAAVSKKRNTAASVAKKSNRPTNYGQLIAAQSIFGKPPKPKPTTKPPVNTKPKPVKKKVILKAKLHGIVAYRSKQGFALISNNNGPQKVYGESDTLQEGVVIKKVLGDKVIVDNNGDDEELLLPVKDDKKSSSSRSSKQDLSNLPGAREAKSTRTAGKAVNPNSADTALPDLGTLKQEVLSDPTKLTDIVRASPAIIDGQFIGFRVRSGKNRKLFRQLNFRANDIITEVNGIVLDDQSKGLQVLGQLEDATDLSIKVKRGTQEIFIEHSF